MDYLHYLMNKAELNGWDKNLICLAKSLMRKYCPSGREAQYSYELMNCSQKGTETVAEYANTLKKLAKKAYPKAWVPEKIN